MCLVARHLEANGIATMCLGSACDILTAGRPPRATFLDYPLGHSAGKPFDRDDQYRVVRSALDGFNTLDKAGQIIRLDHHWGDDAWREEAGSGSGDDTRQPRDETPQFQLPADRDAALAAGYQPV